ncbi:MAG: ATP-dependent Clp protease ATP-binding subunit ClpX, partial [Clostridia bacterium]|nr:ATP-dependent Clp protease ATP-binding subunit ClpX [Clostridia bacterium]
TEPKNSLVKQYKKLFKMDNIDLEFDIDAILAIAQRSIALKTGARGLRSVLESVMQNCMYEAPSLGNVSKIRITKQSVEGSKQPKITRRAS